LISSVADSLCILGRPLVIRVKLERAEELDHAYLLFKAKGEPILNLQYPYTHWIKTLAGLREVRYCKPCCARHTSVSWDLMRIEVASNDNSGRS
jgi:hypothetical protein